MGAHHTSTLAIGPPTSVAAPTPVADEPPDPGRPSVAGPEADAVMIDLFPAAPPPAVLAEVARALARSRDLVAAGVSFDAMAGPISGSQILGLADGSLDVDAVMKGAPFHVSE